MRKGRHADWDLRLEAGEAAERTLAGILFGSAEVLIEVKSEPHVEWSTVFIEHEDRGHPSGLAVSKSDVYAIQTVPGRWAILPTDDLRIEWAKAITLWGERAGGDDKLARGAIVPKSWLIGQPR